MQYSSRLPRRATTNISLPTYLPAYTLHTKPTIKLTSTRLPSPYYRTNTINTPNTHPPKMGCMTSSLSPKNPHSEQWAAPTDANPSTNGHGSDDEEGPKKYDPAAAGREMAKTGRTAGGMAYAAMGSEAYGGGPVAG